MKLTLRVWRQEDSKARGRFEQYEVGDLSPDMAFFEALDVLNERLIEQQADPIAFDSDCREGICGTCCVCINGRAHGHLHGTTACELRLRVFKDGDTVTIEPFRARPFSVIKDLLIDRSALDAIIQAGGFISVGTGGAPDANAIPVAKEQSEAAMDAAQCIGCGACIASCPNASARLFTSAKIAHLARLPQGRVEWQRRVLEMTAAMDRTGFGNCSGYGECEAACPKGIRMNYITQLNRQFTFASLFHVAAKADHPGEQA